MLIPLSNRLLASIILMIGMTMSGCSSSSQLKGRVIDAGFPGARFVQQSDYEMNTLPGNGISGARIELVRDPRSLGRQVVARATSDYEGNFSMDIDAFGAGWMKEEWLFRCTHPSFPMVELFDSLPSLNKPVLLLIDMGVGGGSQQYEVIDEQERIRREIDRYSR